MRANGQILNTTTLTNVSIYQVDTLDILPPALIYDTLGVGSATSIFESESDLFYVISGDVSLNDSSDDPKSYTITELDLHAIFVLPHGILSREPMIRHIADLLNASLPSCAVFSRTYSSHLPVADSFFGLIWNVNFRNGSVSVSVNDTLAKGIPRDGVPYWMTTDASSLFKGSIDEQRNAGAEQAPSLVVANLISYEFILDYEGNLYVAEPLNAITRVTTLVAKESSLVISMQTRTHRWDLTRSLM